nr:MAG TPA: hypothetical protein [Caudoviricetes sp.]
MHPAKRLNRTVEALFCHFSQFDREKCVNF